MSVSRRVEFSLLRETTLAALASVPLTHTLTGATSYDVPTKFVLVLWHFMCSAFASNNTLVFRIRTPDRTYFHPAGGGNGGPTFPPIMVKPGQNVVVELFNPSAATPSGPNSVYVATGVLVPMEDFERLQESQLPPFYPPLR